MDALVSPVGERNFARERERVKMKANGNEGSWPARQDQAGHPASHPHRVTPSPPGAGKFAGTGGGRESITDQSRRRAGRGRGLLERQDRAVAVQLKGHERDLLGVVDGEEHCVRVCAAGVLDRDDRRGARDLRSRALSVEGEAGGQTEDQQGRRVAAHAAHHAAAGGLCCGWMEGVGEGLAEASRGALNSLPWPPASRSRERRGECGERTGRGGNVAFPHLRDQVIARGTRTYSRYSSTYYRWLAGQLAPKHRLKECRPAALFTAVPA